MSEGKRTVGSVEWRYSQPVDQLRQSLMSGGKRTEVSVEWWFSQLVDQ